MRTAARRKERARAKCRTYAVSSPVLSDRPPVDGRLYQGHALCPRQCRGLTGKGGWRPGPCERPHRLRTAWRGAHRGPGIETAGAAGGSPAPPDGRPGTRDRATSPSLPGGSPAPPGAPARDQRAGRPRTRPRITGGSPVSSGPPSPASPPLRRSLAARPPGAGGSPCRPSPSTPPQALAPPPARTRPGPAPGGGSRAGPPNRTRRRRRPYPGL